MEENTETKHKDQLTLKFEEKDTTLIITVKIPNEYPRVLPLTIEDPHFFLEDFPSFWKEMGEKVKSELIRGLV